MTDATNDFDWVTARNGCSIRKVFETLRLQIENDIKIRNESLQSDQKRHYGYSYGIATAVGGFRVFLEGVVGMHQTVAFSITQKGSILASDEEGNTVIEGTPTISDDGKCRLKVNGQERELWQIRKMALEDLFFHTY
jgi:hypothetical protein